MADFLVNYLTNLMSSKKFRSEEEHFLREPLLESDGWESKENIQSAPNYYISVEPKLSSLDRSRFVWESSTTDEEMSFRVLEKLAYLICGLFTVMLVAIYRQS